MTRRLGTIVALVALSAVASADTKTPAKKSTPAAKSADGKAAPAAPAPADPNADAGSAAPPTLEQIEASLPPHIKGPKLVDLGQNIEVALPAGLYLLERAEAQKIAVANGNNGEHTLAEILSPSGWEIAVEYSDDGYVTDDDSDKLDANAILQSYKDGNVEQNKRLAQMGKPALNLDGWTAEPKYEKATHHLVWGLKAHSTDGAWVNYFTRILGRGGFISVNLIAPPEEIEAAKVEAAPLLNAIRYKAGQKYEDHKTEDKSSGLGLRALVLGAAGVGVLKVVKAGILVKFFKPILLGLAAIGAFFKKMWRKIFGGGAEPPPPMPPPSEPPPGV